MNIKELKNTAYETLKTIGNLSELETFRVDFLGKKAKLTAILKSLSDLEASQRAEVAKEANILKGELFKAITDKKELLQQEVIKQQILSEAIDVTLPTITSETGSLHPITQTIREIEELFNKQGFSIEEGPEIEDNFHNFTALNISEHHPARAMHDTFYINEETVLRTHTSPVQIRTLENKKPPLRIIAPGKVYRCDSDVTHTPMFHQVEGLIVEKGVNFAQLKGLLIDFLKTFFENENLKVRFRPSYFPFTEPSAEVDISCVMCNGKGCRICKQTTWLEVLGCGVVHPNVLKTVSIDDSYSALAFGMGVERLAMLKYGVNDLRLFFESDVRFLNQFK